MLQIVTGKFFSTDKLYEALHRRTLFTNYRTLHDTVWTIPVGQLRFASGWGLKTITAEIWEKLEAEDDDGRPGVMVSTSGEQLVAEVADVLAFALNVVCTQNHDAAQRLIIPNGIDPTALRWQDRLLRRTFDPQIIAKDGDETLVSDLISKLVSLDRKTYTAFMRAIQRCVTATHRVHDDVSLAYTLFVAALESLAGAIEPPPAVWDDYDDVKRGRIDKALAGAPEDTADAVRLAVLENEHTSLRRRFVSFVLGNLGPAYYRKEAAACERPIMAADLPGALNEAYVIRSRAMHQLKELEPETRAMGVAETVQIDGTTRLTLEGLHRLTRHVIMEALRKAEPKEEEPFDYRGALPGIIRVSLHPQHWVWNAEGFEPEQAHVRLQGFLEQLLPVLAKEEGAQLNDMRDLLTRYKQLLPQASPAHRQSMLGLYFLWQLYAGEEYSLPGGPKVLEKHTDEMMAPGVVPLVLHILTRRQVEWSTKDLLSVEAAYWKNRKKKRALRLPAPLEAGMCITVAERLDTEGRAGRLEKLVAPESPR